MVRRWQIVVALSALGLAVAVGAVVVMNFYLFFTYGECSQSGTESFRGSRP
ncbi:MAG: hypothetical protein ACUVRV_00435 [Cyanobacteriota bacterium]